MATPGGTNRPNGADSSAALDERSQPAGSGNATGERENSSSSDAAADSNTDSGTGARPSATSPDAGQGDKQTSNSAGEVSNDPHRQPQANGDAAAGDADQDSFTGRNAASRDSLDSESPQPPDDQIADSGSATRSTGEAAESPPDMHGTEGDTSAGDSSAGTDRDDGSQTPGARNGEAESPPADDRLPTGGQGTGRPSADIESHSPGREEADDPNLDYARSATDLVLDYLRDEKHQDDAELLDRLGWTPSEAQQFLKRWQKMRQEAAQAGARGEQASRKLDDQLRGLGLRPPQARLRQDSGGQFKDRIRGLRDAGGSSQPPAEYLEQYRAYLRSHGVAEPGSDQ